MIGIGSWILASLLLSGGWLVSFSSGMAVQRDNGDNFWRRLPIIAIFVLPISICAFWYERRKALRKGQQRKICLKCDSVYENAGVSNCNCGGELVSALTLKW